MVLQSGANAPDSPPALQNHIIPEKTQRAHDEQQGRHSFRAKISRTGACPAVAQACLRVTDRSALILASLVPIPVTLALSSIWACQRREAKFHCDALPVWIPATDNGEGRLPFDLLRTMVRTCSAPPLMTFCREGGTRAANKVM